MKEKNTDQLRLEAPWLENHLQENPQLGKMNRLVNWQPFQDLLCKVSSSLTRRPRHPMLLLFKALLSQTSLSPSDYTLKETLDDRLSFRRFVSLDTSQKAPDSSVFNRFWDPLWMLKLFIKLIDDLNLYMEKRGLFVKKGTLNDTTVIEPAAKKQKEDCTGIRSDQDRDQKWAKKGEKVLFGYKAHLGIDQKGEFIRTLQMTSASVYDGDVFSLLLCGDEKWAFNDKAYDRKENTDILKKEKISEWDFDTRGSGQTPC